MALTFTVLNREAYAVKGTEAKQVTLEILADTAGKQKIEVALKGVDNSSVKMNQVFSSLKTILQSAGHDDIEAENVGDNVSFFVGNEAGVDFGAKVAETLAFKPTVSAATPAGKYTLHLTVTPVVELKEGEAAPEAATQDIVLHVVSADDALAQYESKLEKLSDAEATDIEKQYTDLDAMRQTVLTAISGLKAEDQPPLMKRYYAAAQNQYAAFKLIKELQAAGNFLELEKVTNVGGNKPFSIAFHDTLKLGAASEAYRFYPAGYKAAQLKIEGYPSDEPEKITDKLVPDQTTILVGNENPVGGEFLEVYKIGDKWYKATYKVSEDGKQLVAVNGVELSVAKEGDAVEFKRHTDKSGLEKAIKDAEDLLKATKPGKKIGEAPQEAIDAYQKAHDDAVAAKDAVADYADYTDKEAFKTLQKKIDDAKAALEKATADFQDTIVSDVDYATEKVEEYETATQNFYNSIRKKIRI